MACAAVGLAFVVSLLQAWALTAVPHGAIVRLAPWIDVGALQVDWALQIDSLAETRPC